MYLWYKLHAEPTVSYHLNVYDNLQNNEKVDLLGSECINVCKYVTKSTRVFNLCLTIDSVLRVPDSIHIFLF